MSAIAIQLAHTAPYAYARLRAVAVSRPTASHGAAPIGREPIASPVATRYGGASASDAGLALAAIADALANPAAISNALAIADDKLAQIANHLTPSPSERSAHLIDGIVDSAAFAGKPLLDGTYTATVNRHSLSLPSFRAIDLPAAAMQQVASVRQQISIFQSAAIDPVANAARTTAEKLAETGPSVDDASTAATLALLVRAKVVLQASDVNQSSGPRAENVLALIR